MVWSVSLKSYNVFRESSRTEKKRFPNWCAKQSPLYDTCVRRLVWHSISANLHPLRLPAHAIAIGPSAALPRPHNDSSFNWIFAAAAATEISKKNEEEEKTRIAIFDRRLSLGFILRYFTRLWPSFSCLFVQFFSGFSLQLALSFWRCYFSVTKFTFHTFITFGSCN